MILGPSEDAGIIHFAEVDGVRYGLAIAHESHNHPSQVMPVDGAATGIGGVVRDVYCMGAEVIATLDPLRFGDPRGENGERCLEIAREVIEGIALYGNALGVPNLGGDVAFDSCYDDNCLVNVVAVGLVEEQRITRSRVPQAAREEPYDFLLVGKPTDWSGMGGAAFASADLDAEGLWRKSGQRAGARSLPQAHAGSGQSGHVGSGRTREGAQIGFKDLGAGGIACVSSELADAAGMGVELDLQHASIEPADLPSPVAACSETQERFGIACPARLSESILRIYNEDFDLPAMYEGAGARRVGRIKVPEEGEAARYLLRRGSEVLVDAPISTITAGIRYEREARESARELSVRALPEEDRERGAELLKLLASPALCSRRALFQHFDSEVRASTVLRPGEADAGVVAPIAQSTVGMASSVDGNHRYCRIDPYLGAAHAVVEAARNVACVGASPAAITDCLNFGSPESPEVFHSFVESVRGIGDACRGLGRLEAPGDPLPVISGNVSFYNQSASGRAVAPSPIICCVGIVPDASVCRSLSFKEAGNLVYRIGSFRSEMGGSVYAEDLDSTWRGALPPIDFPTVRREIELVVTLIREKKLLAVHDLSEGGTLVALAEMALGPEGEGRLGLRANLSCACREVDEIAAAFGESGGFLLEIRPQDASLLEGRAQAHGLPCYEIGTLTREREFVVEGLSRPLRLSLDELRRAREETMPRLLSREEL